MPAPAFSVAERDYVRCGVDSDIRLDGRSRLDGRDFLLRTECIVQANGSARVRWTGISPDAAGAIAAADSDEMDIDSTNEHDNVGMNDDGDDMYGSISTGNAGGRQGGTDVLVGVKAEISDIQPGDPNPLLGSIVVNVDCAPNAAQDVESACGIPDDSVNVAMTQALARVLCSPQQLQGSGIDLKALCVIPNKVRWVLHVDALVLDYDGNLLDALTIAARAALANTRLPKVIVASADGSEDSDEVEYEVVDDPAASTPVAGWETVPVSVTLNLIGSHYVVDASPAEEMCADARVAVSVNNKGNIAAVQKMGNATGIPPSVFANMIQAAARIGRQRLTLLDRRISAAGKYHLRRSQMTADERAEAEKKEVNFMSVF
ncbi:hypothetical protein GQ42DRAFT_164239 [Ramicandelaber brevisporus]|nr:hypothetical protein GQ42DRAFT_164239 [Ramicandelaber brevisporus]